MWSLLGMGERKFVKMVLMVAMPRYGEKLLKNVFSGTKD